MFFTIIEDYQWVHLGVSLGAELWHMSVNAIGRRVSRQRVCGFLLKVAKSRADYEDFAEDSEQTESPGLKQ